MPQREIGNYDMHITVGIFLGTLLLAGDVVADDIRVRSHGCLIVTIIADDSTSGGMQKLSALRETSIVCLATYRLNEGSTSSASSVGLFPSARVLGVKSALLNIMNVTEATNRSYSITARFTMTYLKDEIDITRMVESTYTNLCYNKTFAHPVGIVSSETPSMMMYVTLLSSEGDCTPQGCWGQLQLLWSESDGGMIGGVTSQEGDRKRGQSYNL